MIDFDILKFEDFNPSTVTVAGSFNTSVDIIGVSEFIPVTHIFNDKKERVKLISGSRESIKYYGVEKTIIFVGYKKSRRGMRTGAMNNMVSMDVQFGGKNIHVKVSSISITSVGTSSLEIGKSVFDIIISHIYKLNEMIIDLKNTDKEIIDSALKWLQEKCIENDELISKEIFLKKSEEEKPDLKKILNYFSLYLEDFDKEEGEKFFEKIDGLLKINVVYKKDLVCSDATIFNSVFHITPLLTKNLRMPLHRLAPFLAELEISVEYHNWASEGVNVCFDAEEEKKGHNHENKEYKHRFTIHETTKIRQCSPTCKEEAYKYYLGVMNILKRFFDTKNIDYKKYIRTTIDMVETKSLKKKLKKIKKIKNVT